MTLSRELQTVMIARSFGLVFSFFFICLAPYSVKAEQLGTYSLVWSLIQVINVTFIAWLNRGFVFYARQEFNLSSSIGVSLGARLVLQLISILILFFFMIVFSDFIDDLIRAHLTNVETEHFLTLMVLVLFTIPLMELAVSAAQASNRFFLYGFGSTPQRVSLCLILVFGVLGWTNVSWKTLIIGSIFGSTVSLVMILLSFSRDEILPKFQLKSVQLLIKYAAFMPLISVFGVLAGAIDIWVINFFSGSAAVGVYSWGYFFVSTFAVLMVPISGVLFTKLIDLHKNKSELGALELLGKLNCLNGYLAAALIPASLLASWLAKSFLSAEYAVVSSTVGILLLGLYSQGSLIVSELNVYLDDRRIKLYALALAIGLICRSVLGWTLVPLMGIDGAAFSFFIATSLVLIVLSLLIKVHSKHARGHIVTSCLLLSVASAPVWSVTVGLENNGLLIVYSTLVSLFLFIKNYRLWRTLKT